MFTGRCGVRNIPHQSSAPAVLIGYVVQRFSSHLPRGNRQRRCHYDSAQPRLRLPFSRTIQAHAGGDDNASPRLARRQAGSGNPRHGDENLPPIELEELTVLEPIVLDPDDARQYEGGQRQQQQQELRGGLEGLAYERNRQETVEAAGATQSEPGMSHQGHGLGLDPPARWPALVLLPAAMWGLAWASTVGLVSVGYAALASSATIAATAFGSLAPGAAAVSGPAIGGANASAAAAAVAAVDWVDVALRTAAGLTTDVRGGSDSLASGHAQVSAALQESGAGPVAVWAVKSVLPGLCMVAGDCRAAIMAVRMGLPWLEPLAQLAAAAAGLGVLLLLAMPLRPYLAPMLPVLPRKSPSDGVWAALRAGGAVCMIAVLTALQAQELPAPLLNPSVRGAVAASAASIPLLVQTQATLYGIAAAIGDAVLPACTVVLATRAIFMLLTQQRRSDALGAEAKKVEPERWQGAFKPIRMAAVCRLMLDMLLVFVVVLGMLPGKVSAMRLLGMLWLLQTSTQL